MAEINLGRVAIIPKGQYSQTKSYSRLDAVYYNGQAWLCVKNCNGVTPVDGTYWMVLVEKLSYNDLTDDQKADLAQGATSAANEAKTYAQQVSTTLQQFSSSTDPTQEMAAKVSSNTAEISSIKQSINSLTNIGKTLSADSLTLLRKILSNCFYTSSTQESDINSFFNSLVDSPTSLPSGGSGSGEDSGSDSGTGGSTDSGETSGDYITFADSNVVTILNNNGIGNGGKVSKAQASAVTSLKNQSGASIFTISGVAQITSFNELKYFTGLTSLESQLFQNNQPSLSSVELPDSIETINNFVFYKTNIQKMKMPSNGKVITLTNANAFFLKYEGGHNWYVNVYVPDSLFDQYKVADGWKDIYSTTQLDSYGVTYLHKYSEWTD